MQKLRTAAREVMPARLLKSALHISFISGIFSSMRTGRRLSTTLV
jgi:hypothetical protein